MKKQLFNLGKSLSYMLIVIFAIGGLFGFLPAFAIPSAVGLAFAAGAGEVVQETVDTANKESASSGLLLNTIDKKITLIRPDLNPLDTVTRNMNITKKIK